MVILSLVRFANQSQGRSFEHVWNQLAITLHAVLLNASEHLSELVMCLASF